MRKTVFTAVLGSGVILGLSACAPEAEEAVSEETEAVESAVNDGDAMVDERELESDAEVGDDAGEGDEGDPGDDLTAPEGVRD